MDAFIGEIRILPYAYPPLNWAYCNGLGMAVTQNQALYSVIGNAYGGTPGVSFNLPNLSSGQQIPGAAPMGAGAGPGLTPRVLQAASVGSAGVTLTTSQIPQHNHTVTAQATTTPGDIIDDPTNNWLSHGESSGSRVFATYGPYDVGHSTPLKNPLGSTGLGQAHENRHPFLPMNFCICLYGIFPQKP